jgi:hypothetical protein
MEDATLDLEEDNVKHIIGHCGHYELETDIFKRQVSG